MSTSQEPTSQEPTSQEPTSQEPEPLVTVATDPPERPRPGWTEIAVGAVAYLVLATGFGLVAFVLLAEAPPAPVLALVTVAVSGIAAFGAALLALGVRVRSWAAIGVRTVSGRWLLVGVAGGVGAWLVNRVIVVSYVLLSGDTSNPQAGLVPGVTDGAGTLALMMLLGAVAVPIAEELLFRGVLTTALGRYGAWVAVIASSLVFALAHGVSIVLPAAFVLGVLNAVMLRRSGSVWPGVVAHGVNNALVFGVAAIFL
ncbi:CPBP family intramembrane glutamic endopeptidase [Actinomycetospora aeridis]|uniref:Type II CAAX endopeptidase family protein n=1 Tax=Actinomycetospora aeridis TaxID=3129231 RepID=A0ABU8NDI3_9PSEU